MTERLAKGYGFFEQLTGAEQEKVLSLAVKREYPAGAVIFRQGDRAEEFILVEEGKIALQMQALAPQTTSYRKATVDFVTNGEVVGWSAIVDPYIYTMTAVSLGRVKVLAIDGRKLRALMENESSISSKLLASLVKVIASRLAETRELLMSEHLAVPEGR